jgi:nucleoside-diphosphate-sugar epimerase
MAATWLSTSLIVSNSKAKKQLEWTPRFPSYKEGIAAFVSPAP